jgi:NHL repeat
MKLQHLLLRFFFLALTIEASGQSLAPRPGIINTYAKFNFFQNNTLATTQPLDLLDGSVAPAVDPKGGFYIASPELHCVYRVQADGLMYIAAGSANRLSGYSGDGGPATAALLTYPRAVATDSKGNVYISDYPLRKIDAAGVISTFDFRSQAIALAVDSADNLYASDGLQVRKYSPDGKFIIVAGNGNFGYSGDGGPATLASFSSPEGIAVDPAGNIFISEFLGHRVRKVTPAGIITTVAGNGNDGYFGDGGPATQAQLGQPKGLATDAIGNLYIADYEANAIREVTAAGTILTIAGGPSTGPAPGLVSPSGYRGDGGPAVLALLREPEGLARDASGRLYIVDVGNNRIRVISPDGVIQTSAGSGVGAGSEGFQPAYLAGDAAGNLYATGGISNDLYKIAPNGNRSIFSGFAAYGLAADNAGNLYVSESDRIRKVSATGVVTTIAGDGTVGFRGDGGLATAASLNAAEAVAVDASGEIYFSDANNFRIRKISAQGIITTVAGNGSRGFSGDGPAMSTSLGGAAALTFDATGTLFFSDSNRILKLTPDGQIITIAGTGALGFNGDGPALSVHLSAASLVFDKAHNLYFSDPGSHRTRRLSVEGLITTIAGSGGIGYAGDSGPAISSQLNRPWGLVMDPSGTLFIGDSWNNVIRSIPTQQSAEFSLPSSGSVSSLTSGNSAQLSTGFASITPYAGSDPFSGMAILSYRNSSNVLVSEASVPASPAIRAGRIRAEVNERVSTGLAIANPNGYAATVDFFFTNANGDFGNGEAIIPPNGHLVAFLNQAPFGGTGPIDGTFTFRSSELIAVTALLGLTNERSEFLMTTLPVVDLDQPVVATPSLIPQFAARGGWTTQVLLVNPTDAALTGSIRFRNPSGETVAMNINGQQNLDFAYSIPPRASQTFVTSDSDAAGTISGSVTVTPSNGSPAVPSAMTIYSFSDNGITVTAAGVPAIPVGQSFGLYAEMGASVETGIAIANPSGEAITIELSMASDSVLVRPVASVTIPAHGQKAAFLSEIPGLDVLSLPYQRVVSAQSSGLFSMIGIRGRINERGNFLASATLPVNDDSPLTSPLFIPHFADSDGFSTEFVVFTPSGIQSSSGFVTYFGDSGRLPNFGGQQ